MVSFGVFLTLSISEKHYSSSSCICSQGSCLVDKIEFLLGGEAYNTLDISLSYSFDYDSLINYIRLTLRESLVGEYNDTLAGICQYCPFGNYSLHPVSPCKFCSSNAIC